MTSIVCIIPSNLHKKNSKKLELLFKSLNRAMVSTIELYFEVITKNKNGVTALQKIIPVLESSAHCSVTICDPKTGFSGMNNSIFRKYEHNLPDYFLLINDDVWVENSFFSEFLKTLRNSPGEIIAPVVIDASILVREKKVLLDSYGIEYFKSGYAKNNTALGRKTQLATASCMFVSKELVLAMEKKFGFIFNDLLFFYLEDVEFSVRARMIGAEITKNRHMIAYHFGSSTSGKKSYFIMYQTYRNILWVIILTWPVRFIFRNILNIILVQLWVMLYSVKSFGIFMYLRIIIETILHLKELVLIRRQIVGSYTDSISFDSLFSDLSFRTYHGIKIKAV